VAHPIPVYNADGMMNKAGPITDFVEVHMRIHDHLEKITLAVSDLGKGEIFLGYDWLEWHNPSIDW
ncbi:hypothetical protein L218DRAFT_805557, partial [Marasmius fiardii PR-910]